MEVCDSVFMDVLYIAACLEEHIGFYRLPNKPKRSLIYQVVCL
jgi:hypothetical protein